MGHRPNLDRPSPIIYCPLSYMQLSIEEFLMNPRDPHDKDHELLVNPLSAEFGVRTAKDMDSLIQSTLPDFKLVRM